MSLSLSLSLSHTHTSELHPFRTLSAEIFSDKNQADKGRDKDEEEEEEDDDEELWEDVDEDRMTERELAFFSDERLAGSGTENDSFLR
jgi:ribosome-binding protein aMBF1 (putative translation factor)